ncbi:hypothetical protein C0989_007505 [Termitomyces sp. Mn162]|nr:hypothetical protein C0989_007505 [Termitomyces sp. Mn162]
MLALRAFFALAAAAVAVANPLNTRQSTNTNAAINEIVSGLDETMHVVMPNLRKSDLLGPANETIDNANVAVQVNTLITAFNNVTSALAATPVSSGSTTVLPTNDDISILFADCTS